MFKLSIVNVISRNLSSDLRVLFVLFCFAPQVCAEDVQPLLGLWGTETQCEGSLITPKGTKRATPFDVRPDWLGNGDVWCRLNWWSVYPLESNSMTATAIAVCGEDIERDYKIRFNLDGETLTIIWDLELQNGPLMRCI